MPRRLPVLDDRVVYVGVGLLVVATFVAGMLALDGTDLGTTVGRHPAFVAGFLIFVAIYFVSMYVSKYF